MKRKKQMYTLLMMLAFGLVFSCSTLTVSAETGNQIGGTNSVTTGYTAGAGGLGEGGLVDLFSTDAFQGSWQVFSKFNWLGGLMQFIISAFCLIGLFLVCYQRLITMLYLSSKTTFDRVDELKSGMSSQKFLGIGAMFKDNFFESKNGVGLDSFVSFLLTLLPNVKAYSDYSNNNKHSYNLKEDDTITTYMLKVAIPTIMTIFFFSVGFSGTLFKAYGVCVDALATVADDFVTTDLSSSVQKMINNGTGYQFAYNDGTEKGKFKQNVAEAVYAKALKKCGDLTTDTKQYVGSQLQADLDKKWGNLNSISSGAYTFTSANDSEWGNLKYSVVLNTSESSGGTSSGVAYIDIPLSDLGIYTESGTSSGWHAHVIVQRKANASIDYFKVSSTEAKK